MNTRLDKCPLCDSGLYHSYLDCKDYTVSNEVFTIVSCDNCGFKFTNPRPDEESTGQYYESEEYISHSNKGTDLVNTVYKIVRNFTLKKKRDLVNSVTKSQKGKLLDMGCGTGEFLHNCQQNGWNVQGIEPSEQARNQAETLNKTEIYPDLFSVQQEEQFDVITLWHVLEHVLDLNKTVTHLKKLLKDEGTLILAVPNYSSLDAQIYGKYWAAYDVPRHLYHFSQESMKHLINKHGMKVDQILPMKLDAFYVSLLSEKYKNQKQNYFSAIKNGLKSNQWAQKNQNNYSSLIYIIKK